MVERFGTRQRQLLTHQGKAPVGRQESPDNVAVLRSLNAARAVADRAVVLEQGRGPGQQGELRPGQLLDRIGADAESNLHPPGEHARVRAGHVEQYRIKRSVVSTFDPGPGNDSHAVAAQPRDVLRDFLDAFGVDVGRHDPAASPVHSASCVVFVPGAAHRSRIVQPG